MNPNAVSSQNHIDLLSPHIQASPLNLNQTDKQNQSIISLISKQSNKSSKTFQIPAFIGVMCHFTVKMLSKA
jgi:hypothetical protein